MDEDDEDFYDNPDQKYKPGNEDKLELWAIINGCDEADCMFIETLLIQLSLKAPVQKIG